MENFGILAGGLSDTLNQGLQRNQQNDFQQQELKLQAQSQENAQKRFEMARNDKLAEELWGRIQETVEQARIVGHTEKEISPHIQGALDAYRKFTTSTGYPGMADQKMAALWAAPPKTQVESAEAAAKVNPQTAAKPEVIGQDPSTGDPIYGTYNKSTQKYEVSAPAGGNKNTFKTGEQITGIDVKDSPPGGATQGDKGDQFLSTLPPELSSQVKGVADYEINPNTFSTRTAKGMTRSRREIIVGLAEQYAAARGQTYDQTDFTGKNKAVSVLATRATNLAVATNEFEKMVPTLLEASKAVPRTQYKTINAIIQAWDEQTGDPKVVQLGGALNTVVNIYSRAISPTGSPTVSDKDHAREIMQKAWSQGQIEAGVQQLQKEIDAAKKSLPAAKKEILGLFNSDKPKGGKSEPVTKRHVFNPETGELE